MVSWNVSAAKAATPKRNPWAGLNSANETGLELQVCQPSMEISAASPRGVL